ncbi:MAG: hypothetical protein FP824_02425 [Euryarchaeota archaeon]|nr:hypothetical protein [Euryarchaeota archaeon]
MIKHWLYSKNGNVYGPEDAPVMRALAREGKLLSDVPISSNLIPFYGWKLIRDEPFVFAECLKFMAESHLERGEPETAMDCYKNAIACHSLEGKEIALYMSILSNTKKIYGLISNKLDEEDREILKGVEKGVGKLINFDNLLREEYSDWSLQCQLIISKLYPKSSIYYKELQKRKGEIETKIKGQRPDWCRISSLVNEQSILLSTLAKETPKSMLQKTMSKWLE